MRTIECGEISVVGDGSVEIELKKRPRRVECRFEREKEHHPCDHPVKHDKCSAEIVEKGNFLRKQYFIRIQWEVATERDIVWESFESRR